MNHDIAHCYGNIKQPTRHHCPLRNTCLRYQAHLDLLRPANIHRPIRNHIAYIDPVICLNGETYELYRET